MFYARSASASSSLGSPGKDYFYLECTGGGWGPAGSILITHLFTALTQEPPCLLGSYGSGKQSEASSGATHRLEPCFPSHQRWEGVHCTATQAMSLVLNLCAPSPGDVTPSGSPIGASVMLRAWEGSSHTPTLDNIPLLLQLLDNKVWLLA